MYILVFGCVVGLCSECGFGFTSGCFHASWMETAHVVCLDVFVRIDHSHSNGLPVGSRERGTHFHKLYSK